MRKTFKGAGETMQMWKETGITPRKRWRHSSVFLNFIPQSVSRDYLDVKESLSDTAVRKPVMYDGTSEDASDSS
jgi:hypothetical protein